MSSRNKTLLLLHDASDGNGPHVQAWLSDRGLVAWAANDVNHALEELSDFTVRKRPDVVVLEVAMLTESYETLRSAFHNREGDDDISVVAFDKKKKRRRGPYDKFIVENLDQLQVLIADECR